MAGPARRAGAPPPPPRPRAARAPANGAGPATGPGERRVPTPSPTPAESWHHDPLIPTAEEFARRRAVRPPDPVAVTGVRGAMRNATFGLVKLAPGQHEREITQDVEMVRRNFGGLRQVTVVNPKGGAGKTVAVLLLAMTFGQKRGGVIPARGNKQKPGAPRVRAQPDLPSRKGRGPPRDPRHPPRAAG